MTYKEIPVLRRYNEDAPIEWMPVRCRPERFPGIKDEEFRFWSYRDRHAVFIVDEETGLTVAVGVTFLHARQRFNEVFCDVPLPELKEMLAGDLRRVNPGPKPIITP